ncbi:hypothetical protein MPSEU_000634600 [Mayamaea pseudoterrestris]|nr:hypothetical protein MPSEU_000634600 [Mayamaea pseudoterrestris]
MTTRNNGKPAECSIAKTSSPVIPSRNRRLSKRLAFATTLCACFASYGAGRLCRIKVLQQQPHGQLPESIAKSSSMSSLPHPEIPGHKMPQTIYTSKQFTTQEYAKSNSILAKQAFHQQAEIAPDGSIKTMDDPATVSNASSESDDETTYMPAGQHLLIDMIQVDATLLASQQPLAHLLIELIRSSGLTMLSYHCHDILSGGSNVAAANGTSTKLAGVSCIGVLLESHVSIRTWPAHGVMVMDLFTCGEGDLRPLLPMIRNLFSQYATNKNETTSSGIKDFQREPHILQWAYKMRGFPHGTALVNTDKTAFRNPESVDSEAWVIGSMDCELKEEVAKLDTKYQEVEIYDILHPRFRTYENYLKSLSNDGSYHAEQSHFYRPDRIMYLGNVMQSRYFGEAAYHEALVHPSMFAHAHPRRVVIVGGGEGATLREVLKHKTVENVVMLEIDKEMVDLSREYLKEWSDCSKIPGSAPSCFENDRAQVLYTDAAAWFLDNFGKGKKVADEDKFDVVIMDALDPSSIVEFSDTLYQNKDFVAALYSSLADFGIFVSQIGEDNLFSDAADPFTLGGSALSKFEQLLKDEGFERMKRYSEAHGNFLAPWAFLTVWKDMGTGERWYGPQAQVDYEIRRRILPSTDGSEPLRFFDGATMMTYQHPSRVNEEVFCRRNPTPALCEEGHGISPLRQNAPIGTFDVRPSKVPNAGRGVFFKEAVPANTYIAVEQAVNDIIVFPYQKRLLHEVGKASGTALFKPFEFYLGGYGFSSDFFGEAAYSVDASILTFLNHGCNGNFVMGENYSVTEMNADPAKPPDDFEDSPFESAFYNPFVDRNIFLNMNGADTTVRDVEAGEELLDNYLRYLHEDNWRWGVESFRRQCEGQAGVITDYEGTDSPLEPVI